MLRTGDEPVHARSALRMRCALAVWGLLWSLGGAVAFSAVGRPGWAAACAVLVVITLTDLILVIRHIRQGPHYQPGRNIPPYHPVSDRPSPPQRPEQPRQPRHLP
ncbi:DUF6343 family protein [Streptomyces sp. SAJ15]|uniref:DUF6343 family protein n=1 Tax=Streptomyces sp. SAJ15 TaxID=2011095 RepID=UPI0016423F81|nr:DUF6343 family protein [Streptomyces sp. SAJ15]